MSKGQINQELRLKEKRMINRYSLLSILLVLLTIVCIVLFIVIFMGVYIWEYGYNWAVLSFDIWILILSGLIGFFILLNLVLYFHFGSFDKKRKKAEKPKPEFIEGKRVHELTFPKSSEGGIFSKTYIKIDEHNLLRIRLLMIQPNELWENFEEISESE